MCLITTVYYKRLLTRLHCVEKPLLPHLHLHQERVDSHIIMLSILSLLSSIVLVSAAGTRVVHTNTGPTGYEVTFVYRNTTASFDFVIVGGFPYLSNPLCASYSKSCGIPFKQWKPDDFIIYSSGDVNVDAYDGIPMTYNAAIGNWTATIPMPSGMLHMSIQL